MSLSAPACRQASVLAVSCAIAPTAADPNRRWDYFLAFCCAIAFVVALVGGSGLGSLKYLAWGAWWLLLGTFWVRQARQSRQHAQLRARRLRREELGLAPRRGD